MKIFPLAYTKLKEFEKCGRSAHARYITKTMPFVETEAMREGKELHAAMDMRIKGVPLAKKFAHLEEFVPAETPNTLALDSEVELGILEDGSPCGFWDTDCYFRGKVDVNNIEGDICFIWDWKTGKPYEDADELNLHSMLVKAHYPAVKHWRGAYVWCREPRIGQIHILRPAYSYRRLLERVDAIDWQDDTPKKNILCGWCPKLDCEHAKSNQKG